MSIPTPFDKDFEVSPVADRPAITVVFRPTDSQYTFSIVTDRMERTRVGPISPASQVQHRKTGDLGKYVDSEVLEVARRLAAAMATKILSGS
jgi:hypothetical protein